MDNLAKKPLVEIIETLTKLNQQIDLNELKVEKLKLELYQLQQELAVMIPEYEELRCEVINRFPFMEKDDAFKPKQMKKGVYGENGEISIKFSRRRMPLATNR